MKKTLIAVLAVTILTACLFAGCNGAEGGKITDTQQNLSEAMTEAKDMMTDISEAFTNAADTNTVTDVTIENVTGNITNATNNVAM